MKPYFSHDEGARNDPKLIDVMVTLGHEGKSVYWDLVEMMHEQRGYLCLGQLKNYAFALHTTVGVMQALVNDFGLFVNDGDKFWSETALRRIEQRNEKATRRAKAGAIGGKVKAEREALAKALLAQEAGIASADSSNATAMLPEILASKVKESKVKETPSDEGGAAPSLADSASPLKADANNDPRKAADVFPDEAAVFSIAGFRAFVQVIGFGRIDVGYYLPLIQYEAQKTGEQRPNDGKGKTWESFVKWYLTNDQTHNRVVCPVPPGSYAGPNPALQVATVSSTSYSPAALAARNVTKY